MSNYVLSGFEGIPDLEVGFGEILVESQTVSALTFFIIFTFFSIPIEAIGLVLRFVEDAVARYTFLFLFADAAICAHSSLANAFDATTSGPTMVLGAGCTRREGTSPDLLPEKPSEPVFAFKDRLHTLGKGYEGF